MSVKFERFLRDPGNRPYPQLSPLLASWAATLIRQAQMVLTQANSAGQGVVKWATFLLHLPCFLNGLN